MHVHTAKPALLPDALPKRGFHFTLRTLFAAVGICCLLCAVWAMVVVPLRNRQLDQACRNQMRLLLLALQNHQDQRGDLPPPFVVDAKGKPVHSWRLFMAPYCGSGCAVAYPDITKPWNDPANLIGQWYWNRRHFWLPDSGRGESDPRTSIVAITGRDTAFPTTPTSPASRLYRGPMTMAQISDGLANTVLLVEVANSDIHWMEPRDLNIETMSFRINDALSPCLWSRHPDGPLVGFADGQVFRVSRLIPPETLRALLTATGGEDVDRADLVRRGYLK
jgi:hypothetical protein